MIKNKTTDQVEYFMRKWPKLKDDDNRLCANIWAKELEDLVFVEKSNIKDFLKLYASNKLTSAPSIKRARAKLQEEFPKYRGKKYNLRKGLLQDKWRKDLGYEKNH